MVEVKDYLIDKYINNDNSIYDMNDVMKIKNTLKKYNFYCSNKDIDAIWNRISDRYCAGWLIVPNNERALMELFFEGARLYYGVDIDISVDDFM